MQRSENKAQADFSACALFCEQLVLLTPCSVCAMLCLRLVFLLVNIKLKVCAQNYSSAPLAAQSVTKSKFEAYAKKLIFDTSLFLGILRYRVKKSVYRKIEVLRLVCPAKRGVDMEKSSIRLTTAIFCTYFHKIYLF